MQFSGGWKWPTIYILLFLTVPFIILVICFGFTWGFTTLLASLLFSGLGTIFLGSSISPTGLTPPNTQSLIKWLRESSKNGVPVSYNILLFSSGIFFLLIGLILGYLSN
ncbi:MAG: hypothetical protein Q8N09_11785 [Thermodesulfovibrionia bacterium]|nr:hypothetical protein [Thermodesulfovibrionia bacterium]